MSGNHREISTMPGQNTATDMASIEAISVVFAAVLVWLSALVQNLSNASERGAKYVMSDRSGSVSPPEGCAMRPEDELPQALRRFLIADRDEEDGEVLDVTQAAALL